VDSNEAKEFAAGLGISFLETSAKSAKNVDDAFMTLTRQIKDKMNKTTLENKPQTLDVNRGTTKKKNCLFFWSMLFLKQ